MEKVYNYILSLIPDCVDFNFITVKNETVRSIFLDNISDVSILFKIENAEGYIFEPSSGIIPKNKKIEIQIKIVPDSAVVLVGNAKISLDNKVSKIIKMSSIAKYPYLRINRTSLDFGIVEIGKSNKLELIITNPENVPAKFEISKQSIQPGKHPEVFRLLNTKGEIPPSSSFLLRIEYKPFFSSTSSNETYLLKTLGGNQMIFNCSGFCSPVKAWLSAKHVNFKSIPLGNQMTKLIRLYNEAVLPTEYQIFHDNSGAFIIKNTQGIIPAKSNIRINVTFRPYETLTYYERVFCLVKNHFLIPIDLYGTCHNLLTKPITIDQRAIDFFRYKVLKGFYFKKNYGGKDSEILDKINKNFRVETTTSRIQTQEETLVDFPNQIQLHKELFWEYSSQNRLISLDNEHVDFNYVPVGTVSEPFILKVHNNSCENIKARWIYNKPVNTSNLLDNANIFNVDETVFFVQPEERFIEKKGSAEFKVYFKPNKPEYYFYSDMPCLGTIVTSKNELTIATNNKDVIKSINKDKLSETGRGLISQSVDFSSNKRTQKTFKSNLLQSMALSKKRNILQGNTVVTTDPPIPIKLSMVGHSFGPGTQIFMPMYEIQPKQEIFFPSTTINQSQYQTLKIQNKSDTPLYYKISTDPLGVFRVHRKYGLIPANEFHLICLEFSPKDTTIYRFPLRIVFNHATQNMKTIILNGLCTDPVITLEGIKNEIYFPPSFLGIKTKKTIEIKNISPIKIRVNIQCEPNPNAVIEVKPNYFEMDTNAIHKIDIFMCPSQPEEIISTIKLSAERIYDPQGESTGIFNPPSQSQKQPNEFDKRTYRKEITLLGRGSNGDLRIEPSQLEFGTVKVGFHKKTSFSIYNPTITNFYIKIIPEVTDENKKNIDMLSFDFTEGLLNSFCKKDINVTFHPKTRSSMDVKVNIYACDNTYVPQKTSNSNPTTNENQNIEYEKHQELKCILLIKANGDYPLIKIVDLRNNKFSSSYLWKKFNVDSANEELQKQLSDEEINYISNAKDDKKLSDIKEKLKCVEFNFGKHIYKYSKIQNYVDVFLTLKNEGGVTSEFYFKFPDDIAIKREIWMDPIEPSSNDKVEYHVLKEKIFEVEPRKNKLEPNECCNIRLRYNIKEKGEHRLRVIFQIVNGKPLIFELCAESISEKIGVLEIPNKVLDFSYIPIGYMNYLASPIEIRNISAVKIKYKIEEEEIQNFNKTNDDFQIFKIENTEGVINPGDDKHLVAYFRPLTSKCYKMEITLHYTDNITVNSEKIIIQGTGYHPFKFTPILDNNLESNLPNSLVCPNYKDDIIQKCGLNLETIDFGELGDKSKNKTVILYNYSMTNSFNYDFAECGFLVKDEIIIQPNKGVLEPNSHKLIKIILFPKQQLSQYEGDLKIQITWNSTTNTNPLISSNGLPTKESLVTKVGINRSIEKENLYIRIKKKSILQDLPGEIETTYNPNGCFIETILCDLTKEILCDKEFENLFVENIDHQPLGLYEWTNQKKFPSQEEVREKYLSNTMTIAINSINENKEFGVKKYYGRTETKASHRYHSSTGVNKEEIHHEEKDLFGEEADMEIQDKYMHELMDKYKLTLKEMNEKLIVVNEETRKVLSDSIMENTIYNIISEAVYGETDLTEKPRIYFFYKEGN